MPVTWSDKLLQLIPGRRIEQRILYYHFIILYLNSIASVLYHLHLRQYQEILKVLSLASIAAMIWTLGALICNRTKKTATGNRTIQLLRQLIRLGLLSTLYLQIAVCIVELFLLFYFGQKLTPQFFFVLFETNLNESREFLSLYGSRSILPVFVVAFPFLAGLPAYRLRIHAFRRVRMGAAVIYWLLSLGFVALGYLGFTFWHREYNPTLALVSGFQEYRSDLAGYRQIKESLGTSRPSGKAVSGSGAPNRTIVMILGESTSRHHLGLYGYYRDTTPRLNALKNELFVFQDVISPHSHTNLAMKKMLTFKNNDNAGEWYEYPTLLNCLDDAGFQTYWISNQEPYGLWANTTTALANQAHVRIFNSWRASDSDLKIPYDTALLKYLDNVLETDPNPVKFIVLHLMGNHVNYKDRYPPEFNRFDGSTVSDESREFLTPSKKQIISEYDNAVLMSDHVVSEVIERLRSLSEPTCVLFLSDHGEEVYDQRNFCGHTESVGNRFMIEIPFILWLSPAYRANYPEKTGMIQGNLDNPWMTDDLVHTVLDLADVDFEMFDPGRSIVNAAFNPERRRRYGEKDYDTDIRTDGNRYLITENFEKIWAHRVNSIGKLREAAPVFSGVELDLVFEPSGNSGWFDVNHPPAPSVGLDLDDYLLQAADYPDLHFWFDIKNLSLSNVESALNQLKTLISKHNLENRVIVESTDPEALAILAPLETIRTSFYLPSLDLNTMNEDFKRQTATDLIRKSRAARIDAISYPAGMHEFVTGYLYPELQPVDLLTWLPDRRIDNAFDIGEIQRLINDPRVTVTLVGFPTGFDR